MSVAAHLTIRQMRAFVEVYQLRKLSAAAERLSVTQSAVSMLLRQMEETLGVRLFDRTTRSLVPTDAAHDAFVVIDRVLSDIESMGAGFRDLAGLRSGQVHLVTTPLIGWSLLPGAVRAFRKAHPAVRIKVDDVSPEHFMPHVLEGRAEFGLGRSDLSGADVIAQTLVRDQLHVFSPIAHPFAAKKAVRWKDLEGCPLIIVRLGHGAIRMIDLAAAKAGVQLTIAHEVSTLSSALWMASCGMGLAITPAINSRHLHRPDLVGRPIIAPVVRRDVCAIWRKGKSLSPAATTFLEFVRSSLADSSD